jgi:hypothetical protein
VDQQDIVLGVVTVSLLAGVFLTPQVNLSESWENLQEDIESFTGDERREITEPENYSFTLGSDHDHAQFYVNLNGSEYNFSRRKFQLRSAFVHMENYRPHIVHKHSENVTWRYFLQTMDIALNHSENRTCISITGDRTCGDGSVVLNGEHVFSLDREIEQGDNLAIVIPESENLTRRYTHERLPEAFRRDTGREI